MKKIIILVFMMFLFMSQAVAGGIIKEENGKFGLYDSYYKVQLLPCEYDKITKSNVDYIITKNGKVGFYYYSYSGKGGIDLMPLYDAVERLTSHVYKVKLNNKYGIAVMGDVIGLPIKYDDVIAIDEFPVDLKRRTYIIKNNNKYAIYNLEDKDFVVPFSLGLDNYEVIRQYGNILVKKGNKLGLYNAHSNKLVLPPKYDEIRHLSQDYYIVKSNNKYGIYNDDKSLLPIVYDKIVKDATYGWVVLEKDKKQTLFDFKNVSYIIPFKYKEIKAISKDLYRVKDGTGKYGLYNLNDKELILPCEYDEITDNYVLKKNNKSGLYSYFNKKVTLPCEYQDIKFIASPYLYSVKNNDKYGIYDIAKKSFVLPIEYDALDNYFYTYLKIKKGENVGIFDLFNSKMLIPAEYTEIEKSLSSQNLDAVTYICKKGNKYKKYCYTNSGKKRNIIINGAKTTGIVLGKSILTPVALAGDILLDLTLYPVWGYMMSTDANGNGHVFHTLSYKLWGGEF